MLPRHPETQSFCNCTSIMSGLDEDVYENDPPEYQEKQYTSLHGEERNTGKCPVTYLKCIKEVDMSQSL